MPRTSMPILPFMDTNSNQPKYHNKKQTIERTRVYCIECDSD